MKVIQIIFGVVCLLLLSACVSRLLQAHEMMGMTMQSVRSKYGKPDVVRTESPNQIWSYARDKCAILIFFGSDKTVQYVDFSGDC